MTYGTNRRRRNSGQGKYIVVLLLLCCLLIFAIGTIVKRQGSSDPSGEEPQGTTATAAVQTTAQPLETHTVPIATTPITPPDDGSSTTASSEYGHIYIRINHEKMVELPSDFGTDVQFSVSDDNVAAVDESGLVIGLEKGNCILTAKSGGKTLEIPVTVRELVIENGCTYVDGILVANKSYRLPRDYDPGGLLPVTEEAFKKLSADAKAQGLDIHISSDYRTYDFQVEVYNSMVSGYSKEYADSVSARPGHSEHQTGYTIDCNTIDNTFADTDAGRWLAEHCWEYGFIIRYPADKVDLTGYAYESWHIRYVGVDHAKAIWEQGICLEEYLDIDSKYAE